MRWLRLAAPAVALALWLMGAAAQQGSPPAGTPPPSTPSAGTPPARTPPASTPQPSTPQPAATPNDEKDDAQRPADDADEQDFIPTEELQPDAAVTFPVDI
jgi:hypothetical protein